MPQIGDKMKLVIIIVGNQHEMMIIDKIFDEELGNYYSGGVVWWKGRTKMEE